MLSEAEVEAIAKRNEQRKAAPFSELPLSNGLQGLAELCDIGARADALKAAVIPDIDALLADLAELRAHFRATATDMGLCPNDGERLKWEGGMVFFCEKCGFTYSPGGAGF